MMSLFGCHFENRKKLWVNGNCQPSPRIFVLRLSRFLITVKLIAEVEKSFVQLRFRSCLLTMTPSEIEALNFDNFIARFANNSMCTLAIRVEERH